MVPFLGVHLHNIVCMLMLCHMTVVDSIMIFIGLHHQVRIAL